MKNIKLSNQLAFSYNELICNSLINQALHSSTYKQKDFYLDLESKIHFIHLKNTKAINKMYKFILQELEQESNQTITDIMANTIGKTITCDRWYSEKGVTKVTELLQILKNKKLDQESYEELFEVVSDLEFFADKLFDKDLTYNRIDSIVDFIRNYPYYLKTDLYLQELPDMKVSEPVSVSTRKAIKFGDVDLKIQKVLPTYDIKVNIAAS